MQNAIEVKQAATALRKAAESTTHKHVTLPAMQPGEMFAQGDVGILRIAKLPKGAKPCDRPKDGQIAPGNTKGSRHCVVGLGQFYRFSGDPLSDLAFEPEGEFTLTHPEHGHVTCQPGLVQFVHEQDINRQRVLD